MTYQNETALGHKKDPISCGQGLFDLVIENYVIGMVL